MIELHCSFDLNNLKNLNQHLMLDLIRFTSGGISRVDLARQMGLSRSAVTTIVNKFSEAGIVHETQSGPVTGGRRAMQLEINPSRGYVAGMDLGATHMGLLVTDLAARVVAEVETPADICIGPEKYLHNATLLLQDTLQKARLQLEDLLAVGVAVPGPVDTDRGWVVAPPIMPGWDKYPIRSALDQSLGLPVVLGNDAELGALGEWAYGAGRNQKNVVYIKVGSGIGAGLILNNSIYRGESGTAGEIGHITVDESGPECTCGNSGCLEALAGGQAIAQQARQAVSQGQRTLLSAILPIEGISARDVTGAARRGDLVAQNIVSKAGHYLGTAIAGLINLINPGIVIVGGGVAQSGDLLLEPIRHTVRNRSLIAASQSVRITAGVLGRRSTSMGAAVQALTLVLHGMIEVNP